MKSNQIWLDFKRCIYRRLFLSVSLRSRLRQRDRESVSDVPHSAFFQLFLNTIVQRLGIWLGSAARFARTSSSSITFNAGSFCRCVLSTAFVLLSRNTCRRDDCRPESDSVSFYDS
jgi:hypothetical protein